MADMQNLVERLERAVGHLEAVSHTSDMHCGYGDSPSKAGAAPCMQAFDLLLAGPVTEYLKISKEVGGDVQKHAEKVHTGLKLERALLVTVSQCQQPADNKLSDLLASISDNLLNHLSPVSESIQARGWVAMAPKAGLYVKKINDAYKDVDKKHAHIKEFHTTGPVAKELSGLPFGPSAGPDPPSPPPGSPPPPVSPSSGSDESASCSALFAQINQGESITHALKHVRDVKVQVMGKVPTISINKTDGCRAYLSKNSLDCETVTAKSSEKNVLIPTEGSGFNEFPIFSTFLLLKLLLCFEKHSYLPSLKYTSG
uniref:Adenylyl cyclase-associated protein n=1 Tax=Saimiri boliviensis boliviensis TaxID=39432 RepID=A0A2K6TAG0_SAIBB